MDFSALTALTIPEGEVVKITSGSDVLWEKVTKPVLPSSYDYEGEASANYSHTLEIRFDKEISIPDLDTLYVIRSATTDPNIIVKVEGKTATLGNGATTSVTVTRVSGSSTRYLAGLNVKSSSYYFDGNYVWGLDK